MIYSTFEILCFCLLCLYFGVNICFIFTSATWPNLIRAAYPRCVSSRALRVLTLFVNHDNKYCSEYNFVLIILKRKLHGQLTAEKTFNVCSNICMRMRYGRGGDCTRRCSQCLKNWLSYIIYYVIFSHASSYTLRYW